MPSVTNAETSKAGSIDLTMKIKQEKYDTVSKCLLFQEKEKLTRAYVAYM